MTAQAAVMRVHGNAYNIFILVLTIFSLAIMAVLILPIDESTRDLLTVYDNVVCAIFLIDFTYNLTGSKPKRGYFIGQRGWLDLLGSIPSLPGFPYTSILRLARLGRLARIGKLLGGKNRKALVADVLENRGQYATFITILAAGMVLVVASVLILQFESAAGDEANIQNGGDALWWSLVTITTVGYGDYFPVTLLGRVTGFFVMMAGVGIIGALASILASLLVPPPKEPEPEAASVAGPEAGAAAGDVAASPPAGAPVADAVAAELARLREEVAALRAALPRAPD